MRLSTLFKSAHITPFIETDIDVDGVASDSRLVKSGFLFAAIEGNSDNGSQYVNDAIARGAVAILTNNPTLKTSVPVFYVEEIRSALALMSFSFYAPQPENLVAVTGTNGKTSTVFFVRQIFEHAHLKAASIGTLGVQSNVYSNYSGMTTTGSVALAQDLQQLAQKGITHVALEASSHGLHQHRLDGLKFKASGFTNLTRDHLDYHQTMDEYLRAKTMLFTELTEGTVVLNADIPEFEPLKKICKSHKIISYGKNGTQLKLLKQKLHEGGQDLELELWGKKVSVTLPVAGAFQGMNALCALGLAVGAGVAKEYAMDALHTLKAPDGRMELVARTQTGASIFVDYAHTPDGLENALASLHHHTKSKLYVVFGCGGNRDTGKRPIMGKLANDLADVAIITDDNPRFEDAADIRRQVMAGAPKGIEIGDRRKAIAFAVSKLQAGDVLLLAGKGHEEGQLIKGENHPFNDKMEAILAVKNLEQEALWTASELKTATGASYADDWKAFGVSIDTRTLQPGDLFIALKGDAMDGHAFVKDAIAKGAVCAVVHHDVSDVIDKSKLFFVSDTMNALTDMAKFAIKRSNAKRIGITGSSGKTTTKEMLHVALTGMGHIHSNVGNLNNHWGVPLTLARMPKSTDFALIEMGMNHAGEMTQLSELVRPDIAVITTIGSAHQEYFKSLLDIAIAKAEIFTHMPKGSIAVLNKESEYYNVLSERALRNSISDVVSFGGMKDADLRLTSAKEKDGATQIALMYKGEKTTYTLHMQGHHFVLDSLAALGAVAALKLDVKNAAHALKQMQALAGRGRQVQVNLNGRKITIIDDAYNANPNSMAASIGVLGLAKGRKVAVIGDMLELGELAKDLHTGLLPILKENKIDQIYAVGPMMKELFNLLPDKMKGAWLETVDGMDAILKKELQDGDTVLIKSSNGTKLRLLVQALM